VLHDHRVADHQVQPGDAGELIIGVVPRLDAEDHAERGVLDHSLTTGDCQILGRQEGLGVVGIIFEDVGADVDLTASLGDELAHLKRDVLRIFLTPLAEQPRHLLQDRLAIGERPLAPVFAEGVSAWVRIDCISASLWSGKVFTSSSVNGLMKKLAGFSTLALFR